ncbi:RNase adapter RapZ [Tropicimonas sp. S265A]|uniref:RNase adapter RapZ n=1 Tax=Tropicimonas sp. S265A TaxID=3415134 RepID=UPI003C7E8094
MPPPTDRARDKRVGLVLVTGPSGAGRTTAIRGLEDMGFEAIDNIPLSLVPRLLDGSPLTRPIALGLDVRTRDFSVAGLLDLLDDLRDSEKVKAELIYLDCQDDKLLRRFSETRRRHPLAPAESPIDGIRREANVLGPVRMRADMLIDTSEMSPHDLRAELARWFGSADQTRLAVSVQSFSYKRGVPRSADMVFDVRFLQNPYWEADLRALDGRSDAVAAYVMADPRFSAFYDHILSLTRLLLPAYTAEGKSHLSIAFGCTGGQHRSVTLTEKLAAALAADGWGVSIRHRELESRGASGKDRV